MSEVFVDTSALYALLVSSDEHHGAARDVLDSLGERRADLSTTSYVLVETYALLGRRIGLEAVAAFRDDFAPLLEVVWVGADLHDRGLDLLVERGRPGLSLVDAVSILVMQDGAIPEVFAFDEGFDREGFTRLG